MKMLVSARTRLALETVYIMHANSADANPAAVEALEGTLENGVQPVEGQEK
jgi:hypothetical protein